MEKFVKVKTLEPGDFVIKDNLVYEVIDVSAFKVGSKETITTYDPRDKKEVTYTSKPQRTYSVLLKGLQDDEWRRMTVGPNASIRLANRTVVGVLYGGIGASVRKES